MTLLGRYEPDSELPARARLADACAQYTAHSGGQPTVVLTSPLDAADLAQPTPEHPDPLPVTVKARSYIARHMLYVGTMEDDEG